MLMIPTNQVGVTHQRKYAIHQESVLARVPDTSGKYIGESVFNKSGKNTSKNA